MALFSKHSSADPEAIRSIVNAVIDPDTGQTLEQAGAVHSVDVKSKDILVYLNLIQPLFTAAQAIDSACTAALKEAFPDHSARVYVQERGIAEKTGSLAGVKNLVAISSGKGGVGKSTVAANLAVELSLMGAKVGLIDADIHGPSIPLLFGVQNEQLPAKKMEDGSLRGYPIVKHGVHIASIGFIMERDQAAVMRGPMQAGYFSSLVDQLEWGELDFLLFDLPPGTGDIQLTLAQKIPLTGAVIVTTPQDLALEDVRRGIAMFDKVKIPTLGIVENMSSYICSNCGHEEHIFSHGGGEKMAKDSDVPFLGHVPLEMPIRKAGDAGTPIALQNRTTAFKDIATSLVQETRKQNARNLQGPTVQIDL